VGCLSLEGDNGEFLVVDVARSQFAHDVDGDVNGDLLALADGQQVDVLDDLLDGVALDVLDQGQVVFAVDVQGQQGVGNADREGGGLRRKGDVDGLCAVAVDDRRDLADMCISSKLKRCSARAEVCCDLQRRAAAWLPFPKGDSDPVDNGDLQPGFRVHGHQLLSLAKVSSRSLSVTGPNDENASPPARWSASRPGNSRWGVPLAGNAVRRCRRTDW
jgi:hypothetical protein